MCGGPGNIRRILLFGAYTSAGLGVSSHLATPSCGGRVRRSAFYVAWLAEELIPWNKILLLYNVPDGGLGAGVYGGEGGLHPVQERHTECDELSSYRSSGVPYSLKLWGVGQAWD